MSGSRLVPLALAALVLVLGLVIAFGDVNSYYVYIVNLVLIQAIAAIGLVILSGVAGLLSLGTAALLAIGAYTTSILMVHGGIGFVPAALAGALATTVLGALLAAPALRLGGLHLAIVTLAFGVIVVQFIGKGGALTGGMTGLTLPEASIAGYALDTDAKKFWVIAAVFLAAAITAANFVARKPGRALLVLKERELMAQALGVNTSLYKTIAFVYSSLLAGLAGGLYALLKGYISVDDFAVSHSIYFFVMIVIGGMTSIVGGVLGAAFVTLLPELLSELKDSSDAVFGIITVLIIFFLPGGLVSLPRVVASRLGRARPLQQGLAS